MDTGLNNITGREFPTWEQVVPSVGTSRSQRGNCAYTAGTSGANYQYVGSVLRSLRYAACLLLLMVVGVGEMWGQTDYSGIYYIASNGYKKANTATNYYLCPTEDWYYFQSSSPYYNNTTNPNNGQPFMTTYQCRNGVYDVDKATWIIQKVEGENNYYIKTLDGKYLTFYKVHNNRISVHLESSPSDMDYAKFEITESGVSGAAGTVNIRPKNDTEKQNNSYFFLNVTDGNKNSLKASGKTDGPGGIAVGGTIGRWYEKTGNSLWTLEKVAPKMTTNASNQIEISFPDNNYSIYYTDDGTDPDANATPYTNSISISESEQKIIKAIAISGTKESGVVTLLNKPDVALTTADPYTYKAAQWEPTVILLIEGTQTTSGFKRTYSNNINAGNETASVEIDDNNTSDDWFISNVPNKTFSITKAPLTVTANAKTIGFGDDPDPNDDGVTYEGFKGSDNASKLGGSLSYTYTGENSQPYTPYDSDLGKIGSYTITPYGQTSTNYDITYYPGTLTVTEKSIGDGTMAEDLILSIEADNSMTLKVGTHTLTPTIDYTIGNESTIGKYSSKRIDGAGNYTGYFNIRNAFVTFTSDAKEVEWSATFVAEPGSETDIGHALPKGITAYLISGIEDGWAIPEPLTYIPEGVPVLLVANEEKHGFLVEDANANSSDVTVITPDQVNNNLLTEVTDDPSKHFNTREIYVLYQNEFVLNTEGDMDKGKIYIPNPNYNNGGNAPSRLKIAWHRASGISNIPTSEIEGRSQWYTIDGRRLSGKPTTKGLYIVEGKKVMVR